MVQTTWHVIHFFIAPYERSFRSKVATVLADFRGMTVFSATLVIACITYAGLITWSAETSSWCTFEKEGKKSQRCFMSVLEKRHHGAVLSKKEKRHKGASSCTIMTFLIF